MEYYFYTVFDSSLIGLGRNELAKQDALPFSMVCSMRVVLAKVVDACGYLTEKEYLAPRLDSAL
jgi:hypothetical protein